MIKLLKKRKQQKEQAENAVWEYIRICHRADEKVGNYDMLVEIQSAFNNMKLLVDKCPRKFRNDMAL